MSFDCPYCKEFEEGKLEIRGEDLGSRILFESDNFLVFPSLGQIVEGYLLIATKKHYIGMAEVPKILYPELEKVQEKVRKVLTENYSSPLFFEHGAVSEFKRGGCCIEHAHLHSVPVELDILEDLAKHFKCSQISSFSELKIQSETQTPYFFLQDNSGRRYLFQVPEVVPSQYIRQIIAKKLNCGEKWDWRSYLGLEELKKTLEKLRGRFE